MTQAGYIQQFCQRYPEQRFAAAVTTLAKALRAGSLGAYSEPQEIRNGEDKIILYQETILRLQERLRVLGHMTAEPDGQFGPGTKAALMQFQAARGLGETGMPTQKTLHELFLPSS